MEREKNIPFHRIGTPEEIAKIALFLASDDASSITGSLIYADGGLSLSKPISQAAGIRNVVLFCTAVTNNYYARVYS
ncbi:MAG: SDR family oxidoreductase [Nitrososphaeraceae archaeon]